MHDRRSIDGGPVLPSHELPLDGFAEALDLPRVTLSPLPASPLLGGAMHRSRVDRRTVLGGGPTATAEVLLPPTDDLVEPAEPVTPLPDIPMPLDHGQPDVIGADDARSTSDNRLVIAVLFVAVAGMIALALSGSAG